jgi:hypothetical protein
MSDKQRREQVATAEKTAETAEEPKKVGRKVESATKATFSDDGFVNNKNSQYARLVVFNYARKTKAIPKDADINDISLNPKLEKAGLEIVGGNMLDGPSGIEFIQEHTGEGSTTGRPLTPAFAAEVRPFIRRLQLSNKFGRRVSPEVLERKAEREAKAAEAKAKKDAEKAAAKEEAKKEQAKASAKS